MLLQLPVYPVSDRRSPYPSGIQFANGFGLDKDGMDYYDAAYGSDKQHWRASPLLADLAGLPPTLLVTAGLDPCATKAALSPPRRSRRGCR